MNLTLAQIQSAVDTAFAATPTPPVRVAPVAIGDNCTIQTDTYKGKLGDGFQVVAVVDFGSVKRTIVKQSGAETWRNKDLTQKEWDEARVEYKELRAKAYPPETDLNDAIGKQGVPETKAAGDAQLAAYCAAREAVKLKYPKPTF